MTSLILQTATRLLIPLFVLYSVFLLLDGHHHPGGGFAGGLIVSAAIGLCALAYDVSTARSMLPCSPHVITGLGLLTAMLSGVVGMMMHQPFLTGVWTEIAMPGDLKPWKVGTPLLFDLGVYLVVVGMATMALLALAEE
jgi:multicomponent Na+:H+ antiporter subunit B